ncbi:exopolysaccharide biosynthesis protein YbjH [Palleronia aestuarii]|uniref:Exopolysaccharide biosynthesis protein YbjH n=1 Tax=Palleronia aestuarii TaxID=568105 RepID=A0A2W7P4E1_9RHOB|nr:exopolysaccharide biosynthesis protein YbjH [Palleronia aestuarii]
MAALAVAALPAVAQDSRSDLNFYGVTGAIDTPTAESRPDGQLDVTVSDWSGVNRNTLSFQILPRIQGSFRYAKFSGLDYFGFDDYYDRSFDLSAVVLREGRVLPALKIGLQDFVGTGLFSGEYLVATKSFASGRLTLSAGLGWGRLGSYEDIGAPFGDRPAPDAGRGGEFNVDQWFRGPAAPFGSVIWRPDDRWSLMAEYSSDAYDVETGQGRAPSSAIVDRSSPFNFGATYRINDAVSLGAHYLYGSEIGVKLTFSANPYRPPQNGSVGPAPRPVNARTPRAAAPELWVESWVADPNAAPQLTRVVNDELTDAGMEVESFTVLDANTVEIRVRNYTYDASAQAVGRIARALTRTMPTSVETFRIVTSSGGLPVSAVTLRRSDLEAIVNAPDAAAQLRAVAGIGDAGPRPRGAYLNPEMFPRFDYGIGPFIRRLYFEPENPYRFDIGVQADASYEPLPGLVFSGQVSKRLYAGTTDSVRQSNSVLPRVRTDQAIYNEEGDPSLDRLQAAYYFRPGRDLYGRVTAGYLERMFGGVSGEILWKPVTSRLAVGAELNYVRQRDADLGLGFADCTVNCLAREEIEEYDVATGHVSVYYELPEGFRVQLDMGRYLAGDTGATLGLDRTFANGWSVGAFATLTDVSSDEFGEGSFDKGIRFSIPLSWFTGRPSRSSLGTTLRPVTRDGGARLNVSGRLYDRVVDGHERRLDEQWGRVWR